MKQTHSVDDRFVAVYQNIRTGREHRIVIHSVDIDETVEFHRRHGNLISLVPIGDVINEENC